MPRIQTIHTPAEMKNLAINGALDFWQEKVGNTNTINTASTVQAWSADMVKYGSAGPTTKNYSIVRSTNVPTESQAGFKAPHSMQMTMLTGLGSFAASDYVIPWYFSMEGADYAELHGKTMTIGFWFFASVVGTYNFVARNGAINRMYVSNFSVPVANTWQYVSFTLPTDSSGTWAFDNTAGLEVLIAGIAGSTYQTSTTNTWQSGNFVGTSAATNWMATSNAVIRVAMFSIVEGSLGFGATGFQRAGKNIQQELSMCQRYYEKTYDHNTAPGTNTTAGMAQSATTGDSAGSHNFMLQFKTSKRASPSVTIWTPSGNIGGVTARSSTTAFTGYSFNADASANPLATGLNSVVFSAFSYGSYLPGQVTFQYVADSRL